MTLRNNNICFFQDDNQIPDELVLEILIRLTLKDILTFSTLCSRLLPLARSNKVGNALFKRHSGMDIMGDNVYEDYIFYFQTLEKLYKAEQTNNNEAIFSMADELELLWKSSTKFNTAWVSYLLAQCYSITLQFIPFPDVKATYKSEAMDLLRKSVKLGNVLAKVALCTDYNEVLPQQESLDMRAEIRTSSCGLAIYLLALSYYDSSDFDSYFNLLIISAKLDYSHAMFELAQRYLNDYRSFSYIPFGAKEWEFFNLQLEMAKKIISGNVSAVEGRKYLDKLEEFRKQGVCKAAHELAWRYKGRDSLGTPTIASKMAANAIIADLLYKEALPARKARAKYWLEQAADKGLAEAEQLLQDIEANDEKEAGTLKL